MAAHDNILAEDEYVNSEIYLPRFLVKMSPTESVSMFQTVSALYLTYRMPAISISFYISFCLATVKPKNNFNIETLTLFQALSHFSQ